MVLVQESLDHESRAGSESGPRYWGHPPEEAPGPSGVGQPHPSPGNSGDYPMAPPTAPSLQALMKTNPGILKTIQVNEPQQGWLLFQQYREGGCILELWQGPWWHVAVYVTGTCTLAFKQT